MEHHSTERRVGAHVSRRNWTQETVLRGGDVAQIFLGNPRSWAEATPLKVNEKGSDADAKHLPHWVHATYLINVCSENPTVRQRSIKALAGTLAAAIQSGSRGVVVHAGQGASQNVGDTLEHWKAAIRALAGNLHQAAEHGVTLCVENTATGKAAPGRQIENMVALVETLREVGDETGTGNALGACLDTCHSWAAGWQPDDHLRIGSSISVPLIHLNGSRDEWNSGRDRHANLEGQVGGGGYDSRIPLTWLAETVAALPQADLICETPGGETPQAHDVDAARRLSQ